MSTLDSRRSAPRVPGPRGSVLAGIANALWIGALIWTIAAAVAAVWL